MLNTVTRGDGSITAVSCLPHAARRRLAAAAAVIEIITSHMLPGVSLYEQPERKRKIRILPKQLLRCCLFVNYSPTLSTLE
jgi:hypothetical protein